MRQEHPSYRIDSLCRLFGKSRQAYYEQTKYVCQKNTRDDLILSLVGNVRKDFPHMGSRKLLLFLAPKFERMGISIGRDAFIDLLYQNRLLVHRPRNRRKTTFSKHWMHKYPNLIIGYTPESPNRLWVSDITYIDLASGTSYLSLITDACSRKIVGWNLGKTLQVSDTLAALKMALKNLKGNHPELIHHSDRGSQYCCGSYTNLLTRRKIRISMTESGDPRENAIAERVNGILKTEWMNDKKPGSWKETVDFVGKIIDLYNNQRLHQSISYMTPVEVHQTGVKTERQWKNYYRKKEVTEGENDTENASLTAGKLAPATPPLRFPAVRLKISS